MIFFNRPKPIGFVDAEVVQVGTAVFGRGQSKTVHIRYPGGKSSYFSIPGLTPTILINRKSRSDEPAQWAQDPVTSDFA